MKRVALLLCVLLAFPASAVARPQGKRILFFTRSQGHEHSTVRVNEETDVPFAMGTLSALAMPYNWEVVHTKDGGAFTPENLDKFDAFVFITTGDLTALRKGEDKKPLPAGDPNQLPMTAEGKAALLAAVTGGKGFVGLHNASDTFHSAGEDQQNQPPEAVDPFIAMLGGEFVGHGDQQVARIRVVDKRFPGFADIGSSLEFKEEWYALKNLANDLHAVLVIDPSGMNGKVYNRPPYPIAWSRQHGKGRVFYSALGHREDVWTMPAFQKMLVGALKFALGVAPGATKPNVKQVSPEYQQLPARER